MFFGTMENYYNDYIPKFTFYYSGIIQASWSIDRNVKEVLPTCVLYML